MTVLLISSVCVCVCVCVLVCVCVCVCVLGAGVSEVLVLGSPDSIRSY